ncbi:hypothetical protein VTO42DRAFT_5335 [Malbranchea cinnamomea]
MNAWLNDTATANLPDQENGAFNSQTIDPSAFLQQPPNPADSNQFQRMFNGVARTMSPGFHNPNQVIPSKRPRPDDGVSMSMSPRPAPGGLPGSRSQTPQQVPYPGYQGSANGASQFQQAHVPVSYPQFQPGTTNASPSPISQDFDPQSTQRVQTASPSPFSPAGMQVGQQMSPTHPDPSPRVNTPQNNTFLQGQAYPQPAASHFASASGMTTSAMHPSLQAQYVQANPAMMQAYTPQQISAQQRMYQIQLQNHARQMQAANANLAARSVASGMNPMANPQVAAMRQVQQPMAKPTNPEGFLRVLQRFMMARGLPLETSPVVSGRPINLMQLYATVMKLGGSKKVTAMNTWPLVAQQLQFPAMQYPLAAQEIRDAYMRNLAPYEQAWMNSQQKQAGEHMQNTPQRPVSDAMGVQSQVSPTKIANNQTPYDPNQHFPHSSQPTIPSQHSPQHPVNGFTTSPQVKSQSKQPNIRHQHRSSLSRPPDSASPNGQIAHFDATDKAQTPVKKPPSVSSDEPLQHPIDHTYRPAVLPESHLHGPIVVDELFQLSNDIVALKPDVPSFAELGVIDIHALIMSLKSGIHAEMRMALDTLTQLSCEPGVQISLDNCDDLVETLVECAEEQAEFLAENAAEVSDSILLPSYEETLRGCRQEMETMLDVPEFGSLDYDLDRAVDRLICITTILRNFSFSESNLNILSMPFVVRFMSTMIRYMGTRNMLLRTHQNTLDFMKDAVIYLSNTSHAIQLPGREEALSLLHLLLSFAPSPPPTSSGSDGLVFPVYNPNIHRYLPVAVESLAKLLARDDPNRTFYRAIFAQDSISTPPNELLTRAFALSIAPIPGSTRANPVAVADARKPFLIQGMLAADILAGFADNSLARSWLQSTDGFAGNLLRLACLLSADRSSQAVQRHGQRPGAIEPDMYGFASIANRGLSVLCRLAEKSKRVDGKPCIPFAVLPKKENLLGALLAPNIEGNIVRQLCEYAALG